MAIATAGWVSITAGYANHQERLNTSLGGGERVSLANPELLLDRISSWALLHDAEYFARYRAALDPGGGFNKFWWLAAIQAGGLAIGVAATVWPFSTARLVASSLLAMSQAPDLPETCVETVANYRALGVRLPSYRVAIIVGAAVVPAANLVAAMILGWNPAPRGPEVTTVRPPPPEDRGLRAWQASLERFSLGIADRARLPWLKATVCAQWACTVVGCVGYGIGVASGQWWRTHVPLCGIALAVQLVANAASSIALMPWTEGKGSGTALAAEGCALLLGIWRINRSWAGGVTLVAVRTGVVPPPGYILFNAGVIAWLGCAALGPMTFLGLRAPQAEDAALSALPYRVWGLGVAGVVELAGVLFMTAATLVTNTDEEERRMWAGEIAFSQTGDRWWLMYTVSGQGGGEGEGWTERAGVERRASCHSRARARARALLSLNPPHFLCFSPLYPARRLLCPLLHGALPGLPAPVSRLLIETEGATAWCSRKKGNFSPSHIPSHLPPSLYPPPPSPFPAASSPAPARRWRTARSSSPWAPTTWSTGPPTRPSTPACGCWRRATCRRRSRRPWRLTTRAACTPTPGGPAVSWPA